MQDGLTVITLNEEREVVYNGSLADFVLTAEDSSFVVLSKDEEGTVKDVREALLDVAEDFGGLHSLYKLDVLVIRNNRWWSALCRDENCCPPEGNELPSAEVTIASDDDSLVAEVVADLQAGTAPVHFEQVVGSIPTRDRLLVKAADNDLWEAIVTLTKHDESAQAWSVRACAYFAKGDSEAALESVKAADLAGGTSLANLIRMGCEQGAPPALLLSAIRAAG